MYSIFDIFKMSIGPSSSHTTGPMIAAKHFRDYLIKDSLILNINKINIELFGSLAFTGKAHGTDKGIILGLSGLDIEKITTMDITKVISSVKKNKSIIMHKKKSIPFEIKKNIFFNTKSIPKKFSNTLEIIGYNNKKIILKKTYYSIGGGFVSIKNEKKNFIKLNKSPYEFINCDNLMSLCKKNNFRLHQIAIENEIINYSKTKVRKKILSIWMMMNESIENGLKNKGILDGGLKVERKASSIYKILTKSRKIDPLKAMDFVNVYAMAVNEENAAGGKVITAPTNGAAGIIPAVIRYYLEFTNNANKEGIIRFMLTAGTIGILYKKNASISGAEVGCQGEVGVACSMAAAGLVSALGGSNKEIEAAAEIAMEHNLGLTCDPIKGLVQIPCIERNAIGATKSINAARLSMLNKGNNKIKLDQVIKTMMDTGKDMQEIYKETSKGGLAVNVIEC